MATNAAENRVENLIARAKKLERMARTWPKEKQRRNGLAVVERYLDGPLDKGSLLLLTRLIFGGNKEAGEFIRETVPQSLRQKEFASIKRSKRLAADEKEELREMLLSKEVVHPRRRPSRPEGRKTSPGE